MPSLLVQNIELLATFDDARREIGDGALLVRVSVVDQIGAMRHRQVMDRIYRQ
jgi:hypothetical protein